MMDPVALKESPPPQDVPAVSTTPDIDAESKGKKARTTVILREVEPAATEELILALFNGTELKVVSARMDVQNTWFVQMETEEMAKQAISHLSQQILCDKPVKARIKSEGLRTTAQPWQPPAQSMAQFPGYTGQPPYTAAGGMTGQYGGGGWGMKPASINRPPQAGAFKKSTPRGDGAPYVPAEGATDSEQGQQQMGGRGQRRQSGATSNHAGRAGQGGERKGRKPGGQNAEPKVPVFQPQDFPSLGGEAAAAAAAAAQQEEPASTPVVQAPVPEAPANSWAARAKTVADVPAPVAPVAPVAVAAAAPAKKKENAAPTKPKREETQSSPITPAVTEAKLVEPAKQEVPARQESATSQESQAIADARAAEMKRRGWEKPELAVKKESPQAPQAASPAPATQQQSSTVISGAAPAADSKDKPAKTEGKKGAQQGKRSQEKEANGHVSPIVPLPWATKSFAQVIKEKAATPPQTVAGAPSATAGGQAVTTLLPATLKSNERWEDMEDDAPAVSASSGGEEARRGASKTATAGGRMEKLDKLKQSSEMSDDWRRDAAARRKEFEQQPLPRSGSGERRRPNASS